MRRDKTIARILLIFSVANIARTAPTIVRQRHMDVAEAASGKRATSGDEATGSEPVPASDEPHDPYLSAPGLPPYQGSPPAPFHEESWWWPVGGKVPPAHHYSAFESPPESTLYSASWPSDSPTYHDTAAITSLVSLPASPQPEAAPEPDETLHHDPATELLASSPSASSPLHPDLAPSESTFSNDALNTKLKTIAAWGTVVAISVGVVYAMHKEIEDNRSPETYVCSLPSSPANI